MSILLSDPDDRLEFGSQAWFDLFGRLLLAQARLRRTGQSRTVCEVLLNVPEHLPHDDAGRIVWTLRISPGHCAFSLEECPDDEADVKSAGDYAAFRELVRFIITPDNEAEFGQLVQAAVADGRIKAIRQAAADPAAPVADHSLHNFVAAMTR